MEFLQFPIIPAFPFLKVDLSIVPVIIGMYTVGFTAGAGVLLLRSVIHLFFAHDITTLIGLPMNIMAMLIFIIGIYIFSKDSKKIVGKNFFIGSVVGVLSLTVIATILNVIYAMPLYSALMNFTLPTSYIIQGVIPFNLIQGVILVLVSAVILFALRRTIEIEMVKYKR
jgi:riboflavin transporter FmnP